ncbi:MAG: Uma2 family endonuclease [Caldilineaceae bacterium]|nr:Uma2 family endonuclease [Caldilineaceae bacterium]
MTVSVAPERWNKTVVDEYPSTIEYPESDGKPVGETDWHISVILYLRAALRFYFRHVTDLYAAADMLFYYEEGNPQLSKAPDVFVVKGINKEDRATYKLWEERAVPCVIFEITSRSTRWQDVGEKKGLYEYLGVREYFLFDPLNEYLKPQLQGFRLINGSYQPIDLSPDGTLYSQELGLLLKPEGRQLRLIDAQTGEGIPTMEESAERAELEAQRAQAAESKAEQLEHEIAELRRQLAERTRP